MLSVSAGLGDLIQEDIQANMSKMLNVPLWALSVWGWCAGKRGSCWWFLCKSIPQ